ncbi:oxidoreductase [Gordonia sp. CPCC 205515]|uniref:oxidoreductase n=1 Tax=Gordonia sp. CPCC 205515 TaxID=3140791 RepID=UPI003AF3A827
MAVEGDVVRVGLIGYGFVGKTFHAPMIVATPGLDLAAVASSRADDVHADHPDVDVVDTETLLARDDLDLVVIASPNDTHRPLAEAALTSGHHVVVDKPFMVSLEDARAVVAAAARHERIVSVFQNRRWDSDFLGVRQVIDDGLIGDVAHFESHIDRFRPTPRDRWRENPGPGAGLWFDLGPHMIDQALVLFGLPDTVTADFGYLRPGSQTEDWAHVILDYPHRRVIVHGSLLVAGAHTRFVVHGTQGSVVKRGSDLQEARLKDGVAPGSPGWGDDPDDLILYDADGASSTMPTPPGDQLQYYRLLQRAIALGDPNPVPPHQALGVMAVIEAAVTSARTGRRTELALTADERALWS